MQRLYWLASYPRSGSTWLRYLLANAFLGVLEQPADVALAIPDLEAGPIPPARSTGPVRFVKTHRRFARDLPFQDRTRGAIYLVRHPVDVLQSSLRYAAMIGMMRPERDDRTIDDATVRAWVAYYLAHGAPSHWLRSGYGSWSSNVTGWAIEPVPWPALVLRYEDVVADTAAALRRIADFTGCPASDADMRRAIVISSCERLRAIEHDQAPGSRGLFAAASAARKARLGLQFVVSAEGPGAGRLALTPAESAAARRRFAGLMERFRYD